MFISHRDSTCGECGEELGREAWITLEENKGAVCLSCADLDELVFLPTGDAALTRRAKKHSTLSAVVLKFSRARGRYERQGLLVEEDALAQAESECLADSEVRARRNERAQERRAELDEEYITQFAKRIRVLFPGCPQNREQIIAEHACLKYSGRVGRSAGAKSLEEAMVTLAVRPTYAIAKQIMIRCSQRDGTEMRRERRLEIASRHYSQPGENKSSVTSADEGHSSAARSSLPRDRKTPDRNCLQSR